MDPHNTHPDKPTVIRTGALAILTHPSAVVAECLAGMFLVVLLVGRNYPPDARLFPAFVAWLGLLLCAIFLASSVLSPAYARRNEEDMEEPPGETRHFWIACIAPPVYSIGIYVIGFHASTFLAMLIMPAMLGFHGRLRLFLIAAGLVLVLHLVFVTAVEIDLPTGLAGDYLLRTFVHDR